MKPAYAAGSDAPDFEAFCAEFLTHWVDEWAGKPFLWEQFQRDLMGEALAFDERGRQVWESVVVVMPRKNGKTQLLAAYAVWRLLTSEGSPEILLAASSDRQAGRLFDAAAAFVRRNPVLGGLCRVRDHLGEIVREDGGGKVIRMASDPGKLHGYNPSLVICDELAQWTTPSLRRAFAALTTGGGARAAPQVFTITTAGEAQTRNDSILGRLVDAAVAAEDQERWPGLLVARLWAARTLVWNFEAATLDPFDVDRMKEANPASWITREYLAKQAENPELTAAEVLQLHGCVWAASEHQFLDPRAWQDRRVDVGAADDGVEIILAFDGADRRDSTALVGCTLGERPHLFVVGHWENPNPKDRSWRTPRGEVDARVDEAMRRWQVRELVCDPPGWHSEIEEWGERYGGTLTLMFPHNRRQIMAVACSKFRNAVKEGGLSHDGNPDLARHLGNAITKEFPMPGSADGAGFYITKDHPDSPRKIDLAVAAVVAFDRATVNAAQPWLLV